MPLFTMSVYRASPTRVLCSQAIPFAWGAVIVQEPIERLDHVLITNIPGLRTAPDHRLVVVLRILGNEGILLDLKTRLASDIRRRPGKLSEFCTIIE